MLMAKERENIVEFGKKMISSGLTKGTAGNISVYDPELGYMAITPSGIDYFKASAEDIVIMDLEGNVIEGDRKPSSEHDLHSLIYMKKQGICAVVHTHSMYCTVLSCINEPLKAVHYVLADSGSDVIPVAPYQLYGTRKLAEEVAEKMANTNAILMQNHGMTACGKTLESAYGLAATCEWVAELQYKCMSIGTPNVLSKEQMEEVMKKFQTYGQGTNEDGNTKSYFG